MEIIEVQINQLKPAEYNPRSLSEDEKSHLWESILNFGMVEPIVVNIAPGRENVIIGGHQRYYILKEMSKETIPVVYVNIPELEREQELNLRLNKNNGHWDFDMLANFDEALLNMVGFSSEEIDKIFKGVEEDEFKQPEKGEAVSQKGEVYQLGQHRLMCGDSTSLEDVQKLMGGGKARMVFTDPPYNVGYDYDWRSDMHKGKKVEHNFFNDSKSKQEYSKFVLDVFTNAYVVCTEDAGVYCWYATKFHSIMEEALVSAGWLISQVLIWGKNHPVLSPGQHFHRTWEPCLHGWKKGKKSFYNKIGNFSDILNKEEFEANFDMWFEKRDNVLDYVHPTQKPISLATKGIIKSSERGDIVLDLFGGSGSTLMACDQLNRKGYLMELDPLYCDAIRKRYAKSKGEEESWQEYTKSS